MVRVFLVLFLERWGNIVFKDFIWEVFNWNCYEFDGFVEVLLECKRGCVCDGFGLFMKLDDVVLVIWCFLYMYFLNCLVCCGIEFWLFLIEVVFFLIIRVFFVWRNVGVDSLLLEFFLLSNLFLEILSFIYRWFCS